MAKGSSVWVLVQRGGDIYIMVSTKSTLLGRALVVAANIASRGSPFPGPVREFKFKYIVHSREDLNAKTNLDIKYKFRQY